MGREIKRVAIDFKWDLGKLWEGYINPYYKYQKECPLCDGSGYNKATKKISDTWYDFEETGEKWCYNITQDEVQALVDRNRLKDFTHTWNKEEGWKKKDPQYIPTAEEVNIWAKKGFGHDSINKWICVETRAKRVGVWGECENCHGDGVIWLNAKYKKLYDEWKMYNPPSGEAYQLWSTTTEGHPMSPPFATPEELAQWLVDNNISSFADNTETYDTWLKWIKDCGWSISMVSSSKGIESGVKAIVEKGEQQ